MKKKTLVVLLVAITFYAPILSQQIIRYDSHGVQSSITIKFNGRTLTEKSFSIRTKLEKFDIKYRGEIAFTKNGKDLESISDQGFFQIKDFSSQPDIKIYIKSNSKGELKRYYYEGKNEKDYKEYGGDEKLADILSAVSNFLPFTFNREFEKLYNKGGVSLVLNEIGKLNGVFLKVYGFEKLLDKKLTENEKVLILNSLATEIESDFQLFELLNKYKTQFLITTEVSSAFIEAAKHIDSDFQLAGLLIEIIEDDSLLKSVDSEQFIDLISTIDSKFQKSNVLDKLLNAKVSNVLSNMVLLEQLETINSDFQLADLLKKMINNGLQNEDVVLDRLLNLIRTKMHSDFQISEVYQEMAKQKLSERQLIKILENCNHIDSDFQLANVLVAFSKHVNTNSIKAKEAYRKTAKHLNSNFQYGEVIRAID